MPDREEIELLIRELAAARDELTDPIEGMDDLLLLDIVPVTRSAVTEIRTELVERKERLTAAIEALQALIKDGYPAVPDLEAEPGVLADVSDQVRTVTKAREFFREPRAKSLGLSASTPEFK